MNQRVPPGARPALAAYLERMERELPGLLEGLYLHGSAALGAFDERLSDVDFVAVLSRRCAAADIDRLRDVHAALARDYPRPPLEGSYLQRADLGRLGDAVPPHPHIHDGALHPSGHHDINHITWAVLARHGIAVLGPPPDALGIAVDWNALARATRQNMGSYWASYTSRPARIAWLLSDYGVQWAVLGVLRQLYTLRERDITSKVGAGEYGLAQLPARWGCIIREALRVRRRDGMPLYRSRLARAADAHGLLCAVLAACGARPR